MTRMSTKASPFCLDYTTLTKRRLVAYCEIRAGLDAMIADQKKDKIGILKTEGIVPRGIDNILCTVTSYHSRSTANSCLSQYQALRGTGWLTSRFGKTFVKPSKMPMIPSISATGTEIIHGFLPASLNRYSPCSRADHAFPGPVNSPRIQALSDPQFRTNSKSAHTRLQANIQELCLAPDRFPTSAHIQPR